MLTVAQKAFVDARLAGMNGLEAARAAGYRGNDATLKVRASKLGKHLEVAAAIEAGRASAAAELEAQAAADPQIAGPVEQQRILTTIARQDPDPEVRIKAIAQLARIQNAPRPAGGGGSAPSASASAQVVVVVDNGRGPMRDG